MSDIVDKLEISIHVKQMIEVYDFDSNWEHERYYELHEFKDAMETFNKLDNADLSLITMIGETIESFDDPISEKELILLVKENGEIK